MNAHHDYIGSLEPIERPVAQVWASMADDEFKARIGPKVEQLGTKIDTVLNEIRDLRETRTMRSAVIKAAPIIGLVVYGIADQLSSPDFWRHVIGALK